MNASADQALVGKPKTWQMVSVAKALATAIAILAVLILLGYLIENWRGERRFAQAKAELENQGETLDWKDFFPKPVPDEQNAAMHPFLRPLLDYEETRTRNPKGGWDQSQRWRDTNGLERIEGIRIPDGWWINKVFVPVGTTNLSSGLTDLEGWQMAFRFDTNFSSSSLFGKPADDVLFALTRFDKELADLHVALSRPQCRFPVHYESPAGEMSLNHLTNLKGLALVLGLRASARAAAGRADDAFTDVCDIFALAELLKDEPVLISFLVRVSIHRIACSTLREGLTRHSWSEAQLTQFESMLTKKDFFRNCELVLKAEIANSIYNLDCVRADGGTVMFVHELKEGGFSKYHENCRQFVSLRWIPCGWFEQNKTVIAESSYTLFRPTLDTSLKRIYPNKASVADASIANMRVTPYSCFARLMMIGDSKSILKAALVQTINDEAIVACALDRYRQAHASYPDDLTALVPAYLAEMPPDVITGQPLSFRKEGADSYRIWSVGWDEKDSKGEVVKSARGHVREQEGDWVWESSDNPL